VKESTALKSRYRMVNRPGHPLAPPGGCLPAHRVALYEKIGPGPHPCHWCGKQVEWRVGAGSRPGALVVDHVDGDTKNNEPENLVASCVGCNSTRWHWVGDTEDYVVRKNGTRLRVERRICAWCGETFTTAPYTAQAFCSINCGTSKSNAVRAGRFS
jgi:hypothetical protein